MGFEVLVSRIVLLMMLTGLSTGLVFGQDRSVVAANRRHRNFLEQRQTIFQNLKFELGKVGDWCHDNNLPHLGDEITQLSLNLTSDNAGMLPARTVVLPVEVTLPEKELRCRTQVAQLRINRARDLYILARKTLRAGLPSLGYRFIQDVLRINPDHIKARAILGQRKFQDPLRVDDSPYAGEWVSPYEAAMRGGRKPHILHEQFGWIPRAHLIRYEEGLRPWRSGWHSRAKDEEIRRDFRNAWQVESEHFLVKTNVSLEEGVILSRRLEIFYEWLQQVLAGFFDTPAVLRKRFERAAVRGGRGSRAQTPMEIWYFATREEYQRRIRSKVPPGIETNGLYWQPDRRCYFYKNLEHEGLDTLLHEATHQILDIPTRQARVTAARTLSRMTGKPRQEWILGGQSNFWVIEGLACYFESFDVQDGVISVGRPDHVRIVAAQYRLLRDNFYIPLETFCRLGKDQFQQHPNVRQLYSQASGVAHFLMHYDDGRYRDDLVELLASIYRPDGRNPSQSLTLSNITEVSFQKLDQHYREHMENLFQQLVEPVTGSTSQ